LNKTILGVQDLQGYSMHRRNLPVMGTKWYTGAYPHSEPGHSMQVSNLKTVACFTQKAVVGGASASDWGFWRNSGMWSLGHRNRLHLNIDTELAMQFTLEDSEDSTTWH
jgi:hypothetical protein